MNRILWLSTCGPDMWAASCKKLVESFVQTKTEGHLAVALEGMAAPNKHKNVTYFELARDPWLTAWLAKNADIIPKHLGGLYAEPNCRCPGGPFDPHAKTHKMPCVGHWFNRNASRWFRKVAALHKAYYELVDVGGKLNYDTIVWVDSDVTFRHKIEVNHVAGWFHRTKPCFYLKSKRPVLESGVVGYQLPAAKKLIEMICARYESGRFRTDERWDDSYQVQQAIKESKLAAIDLAYGVGPNAGVFATSALGPFLAHQKGHHRKTGIMK